MRQRRFGTSLRRRKRKGLIEKRPNIRSRSGKRPLRRPILSCFIKTTVLEDYMLVPLGITVSFLHIRLFVEVLRLKNIYLHRVGSC